MHLVDISWPITEDMTTYKDRNDVTLEQYKQYERDGVRETRWSASLHTGTHVDAPAHFLKDGYIDDYALSQLCGLAYIIDCTHVTDSITREDLEHKHIPRDVIVLLQTRNSSLHPHDDFWYHFVYLAEDAAVYLVEQGVRGVAIDYLGIERNQPDHGTHTKLLGNNTPIIEGVRLGHVNPGMYTLWCFPLRIPYAEAAPARAVLQV